MSNKSTTYTLTRVLLTTAGSLQLTQRVGLIHVVRFEDSSQNAQLTGQISVLLGQFANAAIPLLYNSRLAIADTVDQITLSWTAQAGVYAVILMAPDPSALVADTPNPRQLVTASVGTMASCSSVTVGTSAVALALSNVLRQSVTIQNLGAADIYISGANTVTTGTGLKVAAGGGTATVDKNYGDIYAISGSAGNDVRVFVETSA